MTVWRAGLALLCAESGDHATAGRHLERVSAEGFATIAADAFWLAGTTLAADAYASHADPDRDAMGLLYEELAPYAELVVLGRGAACFGPAARPLARIAASLGREELAETHFAQALETARSLRSPLHQAHCLLDLAAFRAQTGGDPAEALTQGRRIAEALGLARLLALAPAP